MSEFTVCRTLDIHPALRYCLLLDDMRIAGGKPDYRGDNILISWRTKETYGPVNAIKTENSQLANEKAALERRIDELCQEVERLRERLKASDDGRMRQADNLIDKCHKIACLQGENAKLRDEVERLRSVVSDGADNAREVLAENAALREQVDYMTPIALYAASEQERDRMHELGVVK